MTTLYISEFASQGRDDAGYESGARSARNRDTILLECAHKNSRRVLRRRSSLCRPSW